MNISVKGEYALQAVLDLTARGSRNPVKIADIARRQKIPQKFLELILASLKQGGFVESRRGAEGGYLLAKPAPTIMVGDVLRFFESSQGSKAKGRRKNDSPFAEMWQQVDEAISEVVDQTSFADLHRRWLEKHSTFVPNWEI